MTFRLPKTCQDVVDQRVANALQEPELRYTTREKDGERNKGVSTHTVA